MKVNRPFSFYIRKTYIKRIFSVQAGSFLATKSLLGQKQEHTFPKQTSDTFSEKLYLAGEMQTF